MRVYNAKHVKVIFGGIIMSEFAEGSFLTVEKNESAFTNYVGIYGEVARAPNNDQTGKITVRLMQSSVINAALSAIHLVDLSKGIGVLPLLITETIHGTHLYEATNAWIKKFPDAEFDRQVVSRDWVFETDRLINFEGYNFQAGESFSL